jgi:hypothetical protein
VDVDNLCVCCVCVCVCVTIQHVYDTMDLQVVATRSKVRFLAKNSSTACGTGPRWSCRAQR